MKWLLLMLKEVELKVHQVRKYTTLLFDKGTLLFPQYILWVKEQTLPGVLLDALNGDAQGGVHCQDLLEEIFAGV